MAGVTDISLPRERDQIAALFEMRWRLFVRNMQRDEEKVSFVLWLVGRILIFLFSVGLGISAAFLLYFMQSRGMPFSPIFHAVFAGWQLLNLFRGSLPQGAEGELYRFPLRFRTYVLLWLSAGAFEGLTLIGTWICVGMWCGMVAGGANAVHSAAVMFLFYALNLLMTRAVFLWLGRMLASRRARDFVLVLTSLLSIGPQLLRMQHERIAALFQRVSLPPWVTHVVHSMPGYVAAQALQPSSTKPMVLLVAWTALPTVLLFIGLHRSFLGEESHEFRAAASDSIAKKKAYRSRGNGSLIGAIASCEWDKLRHGGAAIYTALTPLLYVVFFGVRLGHSAFGAWIIPIAAGYLGLSLRSANAFGQDGPGVQTYLLAPVPLRTILLGKNLFAIVVYIGQVLIGSIILIAVTHQVTLASLLFTAFWMVAYACIAFVIGNRRSIRSPAYIPSGKVTLRDVRRTRRSGGGGWHGLIFIMSSAAIGGGIISLALWLHMPLLAPLLMLPFAIAGIVVYRKSLNEPSYNGDILQAETLLSIARTA